MPSFPPSSHPRIDAHQHVFWHGLNADDLVEDMDAHAIGLAWLLTWEIPDSPLNPDRQRFTRMLNPQRVRGDGSHPGIILDDLLAAQSAYPNRFLLGYCPNPELPNAAELFETACEMHGVRICGEWKFRMLIDDPRSLELFRAAGRQGAPVILHLDVPYLPGAEGPAYHPFWYGGTVANLERALIACPETVFIGHAPGFWRAISGDEAKADSAYPKGTVLPGGQVDRLLSDYPNLYADLSAGSALIALKRDQSFTLDFFQRHADRLLFARDYYGGDLLDFLGTLNLTETVQRKVFYENALKLVPPDAVRKKRDIFRLS